MQEGKILAAFPEVVVVPAERVAEAMRASGRRIAVLDDDPTGTQTVVDVPVLTTWSAEDLRWALRQPSAAFYVLTNTRSLSAEDAAGRNREVTEALLAASAEEGVGVVIASRSDSTLRGYYPLETDVIDAVLEEQLGQRVDGVVIAPAYIEGGRVTIDSRHWLRTPGGLLPAGDSEFARDATFGYRSSDLRDWVEEKTLGAWKASDVARITLADLRRGPSGDGELPGGVGAVAEILLGLRAAQPVVVDAVTDDDLRILSLGILQAEQAGHRFLYRVGPSFVRARAGLAARPPLRPAAIDAIRAGGGSAWTPSPDSDASDAVLAHADTSEGAVADGVAPAGGTSYGLVIVGSHVGQTTRQLAGLRQLGGITEIVVDVGGVLDAAGRTETVRRAVAEALVALERADVVVSTSREVVTGEDADASLAIARGISAVLVQIVASVVAERIPRWIVAKGGITSSDIATHGLGIRRAWVRGTLLPGIVSLWDPAAAAPGLEHVPYIVFAGNVGDDAALAAVVTTLRGDL